MNRGLRALPRLLVVSLLVGLVGAPPASAEANNVAPASRHTPVYAYFYQWFEHGSWSRAKQDYPLAGKYSSDDPHVLRAQVIQARSAGIDGFLTSWKDTPALDRRLTLLLDIARSMRLDVGVVYEALDFQRQPQPIATVRADLVHLVSRWNSELTSTFFGRPVIIWTGTDQYSLADVESVSAALHGRALLLAASKDVAHYERIAGAVDGEAYYWSSADPHSPTTSSKIDDFAKAVHARGQTWIAPAAPGFDGRTLGHSRVISRDGGKTLQISLDNAYGSHPDAIGVISWNEWSENTYIEPGKRYGSAELNVLQRYLANVRGTAAHTDTSAGAAAGTRGNWTGLQAAGVLAVVCLLGFCILVLLAGRTPRPRDTHVDSDGGPMNPRLGGRPPAGAAG
jgi:hypothetical protein